MPSSSANGGPSLLFVDDEPLMLQAFARVVRAERPDWEVETARCADQACRVLAARHFDALVVDIVMPGMNGLELLGHARLHHPSLVRVVYSGVVERFLHHDELCRADLVFAKPALATER